MYVYLEGGGQTNFHHGTTSVFVGNAALEGCVTVAHRTSGHRVFVTSAHRYCDNWSLPSGHLVIEILDIWSSKSGHLVIAFLKFAPQL